MKRPPLAAGAFVCLLALAPALSAFADANGVEWLNRLRASAGVPDSSLQRGISS
ncbi:MAG TPA: hypothetical protein VL354_03010 [Spirochaetia bacterium]|nr:hypothetical protein [Spirochaetia bacterium]